MNFSIGGLISKAKEDTRRATIIGIVGVVLLILIIMSTTGGSSGDQKLLTRSFANLLEADTFHTTAMLDLQLPVQLGNRERPIVGIKAEIDGDVAYEESTPILTGTLDMEARGRGMILFTDGDIRLLSDTTAFRLENLPALLNPQGNLVEKWTYVDSPVLATNNIEDVRAAMTNLFQGMEVVKDDSEFVRFNREVTPEQEDIIAQVFRQSVSGNQGLQVINRLIRTFDIDSLSVWVDDGAKEVRKVEITFIRPDTDEKRATVSVEFSDYGKTVEIDRPEKELSVRPEVFGNIFGQGDIGNLQ